MDEKDLQVGDIHGEISEQEITELVNISIICRVCANQSDKLIGIFSEDGISNGLAMKINLYLPIKVAEGDDLPLQCCWSCASSILAWHDMIVTCVDADRRLRSYNLVITDKQLQEVNFAPENVLTADGENIIKDEANETQDTATSIKSVLKSEPEDQSSSELDVTGMNKKGDRNLSDGLETCSDLESDDGEIIGNNDNSDGESGNEIKAAPNRRRRTGNKSYSVKVQEYLKFANFDKKSCNVCQTSYGTHLSLKKHIKDIHNLKEPKKRRRKEELESLFKCFHCDKSYNRKYDMEKHVKKKHPDVKIEAKQKVKTVVEHCKIETPEGVTYKCESCDHCFKSSYTLIRHQTIHTNARTHFCHICGKNFKASSALNRHINEHHHGIKRFNCSICNKMFRTKAGRDEHLNIHNNVRPFVCDTCGKSFKQRASLHVHKMFHTNNFRFSCDVCDKKFLRKTDLKQHNLIHTGEKPFKCTVCDLGFRLRYDLKRHMRVHLKAACNKCGMEFGQERHLKKHHKECRQGSDNANVNSK